MRRYSSLIIFSVFVCAVLFLSVCGGSGGAEPTDAPEMTAAATPAITNSPSPEPTPVPETPTAAEETPAAAAPTPSPQQNPDEGAAIPVVANASSITVLVNKSYLLPEGYKPDDLVVPDVPFIFTEKLDKRKMRKEAAAALEVLFAAAKLDDIELAGASGYRSQATQTTLFHSYVKRDGLKEALRYSAWPGQSEHQTGLAMDVSSADGKCAISDCFGGTKEAIWLGDHAHEYGFIIRYEDGKESITGYKYEPWHLRYVGVDLSKGIKDKGLTLEEYFGNDVPVIK